MEHINYECVSSSVSLHGWMSTFWFSLFENSAAQRAETLLSLSSGRQHCNPTAPTWIPPSLQLIYFFPAADVLSHEEDYCAPDKSV